MDISQLTQDFAPPTTEGYQLIKLPEGEVDGFDANWTLGWTGHQRKYTGDCHFLGAGRTKTHVTATDLVSSTVFLGEGRYIFESMTIHVAPNNKGKAIHAGWENTGPNIDLVIRDCDIVADEGKPYWGVFTYNCDQYLEDVDFYCAQTREHASYSHGYASKKGLHWKNVRVHAVGAEGCKNTNRPGEVRAYHPNTLIWLEDCVIQDWHQPWSVRGGAGFTAQGVGGATNVILQRCLFRGSAYPKERCVMIDDDTYRHFTQDGSVGSPENTGPATGFVILEGVGVDTGPGRDQYDPAVRVGPLDPRVLHSTARGFGMRGCGVYGKNTTVQLSKIQGPVIIEGCNTPAIRTQMAALGAQTTFESLVAWNGSFLSLSDGVRGAQ